jgi:PTS system mannose-specific IIA component
MMKRLATDERIPHRDRPEQRPVIGIVLVTHGRLAEELKTAALTIQPDIEQIVAVALDWSQVGDDASRQIAEGLEKADRGDGAVILTDMFGGTPTNLTLPFLKRDRVEIVTGVNLPMLLKCAALQKSGKPVVEIAHVAKDRGQRSIYVASDLLADEAVAAAGLAPDKGEGE